MTLLVRCETCARQYDATDRAIDSRFRCHCGMVVTVNLPAETNGHNAAVVRCSSCGGPRRANASACQYCHADFTLHERDLHTVCRKCLARVSDKAKFCHSCGDSLLGEACASMATDLSCPSCGTGTTDSTEPDAKLRSRELGKDNHIMECELCAGMWLRNAIVKQLLKQAKAQALEEAGDPSFGLASKPGIALTSRDERPSHAPIYRACPDCGHHMRRHIFAERSGIIIDSCQEHGVWFDAEELDLILTWVRAGGVAGMEESAAPAARTSNRQALHDYSAVKREPQPITFASVLDETLSIIGKVLSNHRRW